MPDSVDNVVGSRSSHAERRHGGRRGRHGTRAGLETSATLQRSPAATTAACWATPGRVRGGGMSPWQCIDIECQQPMRRDMSQPSQRNGPACTTPRPTSASLTPWRAPWAAAAGYLAAPAPATAAEKAGASMRIRSGLNNALPGATMLRDCSSTDRGDMSCRRGRSHCLALPVQRQVHHAGQDGCARAGVAHNPATPAGQAASEASRCQSDNYCRLQCLRGSHDSGGTDGWKGTPSITRTKEPM